MKYDIYKGTIDDMEGVGGETIFSGIDLTQIVGFCKKHNISVPCFLEGNYFPDGDSGYWIEEAMLGDEE